MASGTVLITGARGFTGRYLFDELRAHGYRVVGTVRSAPQDPGEIACDLTDPAAVRATLAEIRPDVLVHLAAISFVGHGDTEAIYQANILGALHIFEALDALGQTPKVLLASSANVYGNTQVEVLDESHCPCPVNHYAISKLAMEHLAGLWAHRLPLIVARPFNYTGAGQAEHFLLPKIVTHFQRRAPLIELGNLDVYRDFSDVRAVVACYRRLLESNATGTFNICSGRDYSIADILSMMTTLSGHAPEVRVNPAFVRANEVKRLRGSPLKLEQAIGTVNAIPLLETLRWMYQAPK